MTWEEFHRRTRLPYGAYEEWLTMSPEDQQHVIEIMESPTQLFLICHWRKILVIGIIILLIGAL